MWRNKTIDFECMHTYPLTEESLRQVCGFHTTFQRIVRGYGIFPSKKIAYHQKIPMYNIGVWMIIFESVLTTFEASFIFDAAGAVAKFAQASNRTTIGRFNAFFSSVNGNKIFAINCESCVLIVVESMLVSSHLFTLLKNFGGL